MNKEKLKKINDRLFSQPCKDNKSFCWAKHPKRLSMKLIDIRIGVGLSVKGPEATALDESCSDHFGRYIIANGIIDNREIGIIKNNGDVTPFEGYDQLEIIISSSSIGDVKSYAGSLTHNCGESLKWENKNKPYLSIQFYVHDVVLKRLCYEISLGIAEVKLSAYVDVFQSEVEAGLAEPYMKQWYYVEEGSRDNVACLSSISAWKLIQYPDKRIENSDNYDYVKKNDLGVNVITKKIEAEELFKSYNNLALSQAESLRVISKRLGSIRTVGIVVALLFFIALLK